MAPAGSSRLIQARESLPEGSRSVFDELVFDYKFLALKCHGAPFVSYLILAELVRAGWRPSAANRTPPSQAFAAGESVAASAELPDA